jgi:hypothetical protein
MAWSLPVLKSREANSGGRRAPRRDQRLGGFHRDAGVTAIGVGTDSLAELLVQRRATDQHDVVVAQALFLEGVDDHLHVGHRRGQQCG